ncbi:MAG: ABC-F family ATP-binding cassette domain-containing protein [Flavobacteriaceae bacterium]
MLNVHNAAITFSGSYLFQGVSFKLSGGDRVGLIGKNGAGKSTLLKVLSKQMELDEGVMATDKEISIGILRQDIDFVEGRTVLEESYQAFEEILKVENEIDRVNQALAERTDYESGAYHDLMVAVSDLGTRYEILGGYNYQGDTERVLFGLGFKREDLNRLTDTFSGGWRMRIELAKLLLQKHDVLLLDEPTNHLDIESILWLEQFLTSYPGAVVIVSHDRMFLDNVTNRTIEISLGRIYDYKKPYTAFMAMRDEIREQQLSAQKNQEKQIEQTERLIEKFRAKASKASMAQSLIKKLDKIDRIEVDTEDTAVMNVRFPVSIQPGKVVLDLQNLSKSYGDKQVLKDVSFLLERQSKTAFVGQNGQGKSTLAKIIVGELDYQGDLKLGHNVQIGYFAQNQAEYLDQNKTLLQTMIDAANETNRSQVRDILGAFLFQGDEVEKQVKVLSGGERNRLALAKLLLQPFNVLVMDEPTNHLDMRSKEVLKKALLNFAGTLIVVSHDRDFLQGLSSQVFEFKDHRIKPYLGDIDFYLEQRKVDDFRAIEKRQPEKSATAESSKSKSQEPAKPIDYQQQKQLKNLQNRLKAVEREIADHEQNIANWDHEMLVNYDQAVADPKFLDRYNQTKQSLEEAMQRWEGLTEELEALNASL